MSVISEGEGHGIAARMLAGFLLVEHGKQNPTIGALLRLARALEVPLDRLVILDGTPPGRARATRART
jgi:hypothetical protein